MSDSEETRRIRVEGCERSYDCAAGDTILRAALRAGLPFPYECNSGSCGTCKFELLEGEVESLWPEAPGLKERDKRKGKRLGCQSRPLSDGVIRFRADESCIPRKTPKVVEARFTDRRPMTHDLAEFEFQTGETADFLPGQYALLELPGVTGLRAFSMSNLPNPEGVWQLQIKNFPGGAGSAALFERLKVGDRVRIDGPYGLAYFRTDTERDIVCIAGGSGIAPMISIARGHAASPGGLTLDFFYGGRGPEDICGRELLEALPGFGERIHYHPVISMPELDPEGRWRGPTGFVHEEAARRLSDLADHEYYLAGPPPMVDATLKMLVIEQKVPVAQIHYDRFY